MSTDEGVKQTQGLLSLERSKEFYKTENARGTMS